MPSRHRRGIPSYSSPNLADGPNEPRAQKTCQTVSFKTRPGRGYVPDADGPAMMLAKTIRILDHDVPLGTFVQDLNFVVIDSAGGWDGVIRSCSARLTVANAGRASEGQLSPILGDAERR